jgi:predicted NUDIX family phosphoesterase
MVSIVIRKSQQLVIKTKMKNELTLAIPTEKVWNFISYQKKGVIKALDASIMDELLQYGVFKHRNELEEDPSFKQIIPYAVICHMDEVYMFKRLNRQTEVRLHNKCSLGVGGHMNPFGEKIDTNYLHHELEREIREWLANNWYKVLSLALSAVIALHWIKTDAIPFILNWFKQ